MKTPISKIWEGEGDEKIDSMNSGTAAHPIAVTAGICITKAMNRPFDTPVNGMPVPGPREESKCFGNFSQIWWHWASSPALRISLSAVKQRMLKMSTWNKLRILSMGTILIADPICSSRMICSSGL